MFLIDLTSTENAVKALKDSRGVVAESILNPQPLAFSEFFIFSEQVRDCLNFIAYHCYSALVTAG